MSFKGNLRLGILYTLLVSLIGLSQQIYADEGDYGDMYSRLLPVGIFEKGSFQRETIQNDQAFDKSTTISAFCRFEDDPGLYCAKYQYLSSADRGREWRELITEEPEKMSFAQMLAADGKLIWSTFLRADQILVQLKAGVNLAQLKVRLPEKFRAARFQSIGKKGLYLLSTDFKGLSEIEGAVSELSSLKDVIRFAEPDYVGLTFAPPADTYYSSKQTYLSRINAEHLWASRHGVASPTEANKNLVAVLDTGIDNEHVDLTPNLAGALGYNFVNDNFDWKDVSGHGTHVAGVIGAKGNNSKGVCGLCWDVKMVPMRVADKLGKVNVSNVVKALERIGEINLEDGYKVTVVNHSWGMTGFNIALYDGINFNEDSSFVPPDKDAVTATWVGQSCALTVTGPTGEVERILPGMSVTGIGVAGTLIPSIVSGIRKISSTDKTTTSKMVVCTKPYQVFSGSARPLDFTLPKGCYDKNIVHVASVGGTKSDIDAVPIFPACLPSNLVVAVGASDGGDQILKGAVNPSNFGQVSVDLFAPGLGIFSTYWNGYMNVTSGYFAEAGSTLHGYYGLTGPSVSGPQVAGALALLRMKYPLWDGSVAREKIKKCILKIPPTSGVAGSGLIDKCDTGGRLDLSIDP